MELLDVFAVVVEQVSLNKASQLLNISQPALSRKIMKLEEELGVELFIRKGKRLELTKVGQICYDHALELRHLERKVQASDPNVQSCGQPHVNYNWSQFDYACKLHSLISLQITYRIIR